VVKAGSKKERIFLCGVCIVCDRNHYSNEGYWIVTAAKTHLCKEPCWDEYLANPSKYMPQKTLSEAPELTKRPRPRGKYPYKKYKLKWY